MTLTYHRPRSTLIPGNFGSRWSTNRAGKRGVHAFFDLNLSSTRVRSQNQPRRPSCSLRVRQALQSALGPSQSRWKQACSAIRTVTPWSCRIALFRSRSLLIFGRWDAAARRVTITKTNPRTDATGKHARAWANASQPPRPPLPVLSPFPVDD